MSLNESQAPALASRTWPTDRAGLYKRGLLRMQVFCQINHIPAPVVYEVSRDNWYFDACAFYRPDDQRSRYMFSSLSDSALVAKGYGVGINICLAWCGTACGEAVSRNWSWPGNATDRTPFGVIAHELGHHCDWLASDHKGRYFGDYGESIMNESGELPISGYCPNHAEWWAEMARLFITNPDLLKRLRPKTYGIIERRWSPVFKGDWLAALGSNVPARVVRSLYNKGA